MLVSENNFCPPPVPETQNPGTTELRLRDPEWEKVYFELVSSPDVLPIPYQELMRRAPNSEVKIRLTIDENGRVIFDPQRDILVKRGMIERNLLLNVVQTWRFTAFKHGTLVYWFNMGSAGRQVTVDTRNLKKLQRYYNSTIPDGRMCKGVPRWRWGRGRVRWE